MKTSDFDYLLPSHLIAQSPVEPRDHSRLMVLHCPSGVFEHRRFDDICSYLKPGDVLVLNDTRVLPARLRGARERTGGRAEVLLLRRVNPGVWEGLVKPARRLRKGAVIVVTERPGSGTLSIEVLEATGDGARLLRLSDEALLAGLGEMPLPPYIRSPLSRPDRYQTVYASVDGSAAAPTAGLHFTPELLGRLSNKGVRLVFLTMHIGLDTFLPVREEDPARHPIHREYGEMSCDAVTEVARALREGRRIVAVGTSTVRLLEHVFKGAPPALVPCRSVIVSPSAPWERSEGLGADQHGRTGCCWRGWVDTFILPGHTFRAVDAMVTNFHLPQTTLLMLVSAFAGWGRILSAYEEAIRERYRFYSFGDAMLLLTQGDAHFGTGNEAERRREG